jgi:predicted alpha/beta-fold hydrolase
MLIESNPTETNGGAGDREAYPPFEPHPWLRGAHAQTIVARYWPSPRWRLAATSHELALPDGDRLLVLESTPPGWDATHPTAVLIHGLAGCAEAGYMVRTGARLCRLGIRVVRVNLRGSGRGFGLARGIYHAGRSDDLRAVVDWIRRRAVRSPIVAVGFSLGAHLVLKLAVDAGEKSGDHPFGALPGDCVLAANPPIDLIACAGRMAAPENRVYDWNFARWLRGMVGRLHRRFPELGPPGLEGVRTLYAFDDRYTAPRGGFASADDYYRRCCLVGSLARITVPGLIVHAMDDPFIPHEPFLRASRPPGLALELLRHGGHMGYFSRYAWDGDRRWLDARLAAWLRSHWGLGGEMCSD